MSPAPAIHNPASNAADRREGVGGSDVAVLLGLSPYKTPLDLYLQKRGLWEDEFESEAAHWGNVMEPVLAREYSARFGLTVARRWSDGTVRFHKNGEVVHPYCDADRYEKLLGTLVHPDYPWARGHIDGIGLGDTPETDHVCEFKTADSRLSGYWGDEDTDQIPEAYLCQVQWYLMLAELEVAHVAALIGGNRFQRYIVPRDEQLIGMMLEQAAAFWDRVERGDPPAPEPGERGKASLSRLYPAGSQGKELAATPTLANMARALHALRKDEAEAKEAKTSMENEIKLIMADAVRLNLGPKTYIGWANNKDSQQIDWEAVAKAAGASPKLIAQHTTKKPGARVFRCQGFEKLFDQEK